MIIEFHDNDVGNLVQGTLHSTVGHRGTIGYAHQAEAWVQERFGRQSPITRAFIRGDGTVYAVIKRNPDGTAHYVARSKTYDGKWELPYAYDNATILATMELGSRVNPADHMEVASRWASGRLAEGVACAVVLDEQGVFAAWEQGADGPMLVARGQTRSVMSR